MSPRGCLIALAVTAAITVGGFHACAYDFRLDLAPKGLGVWRILYEEGQSWGFGPGGNETGVIVYGLPSGSARKVAEGGAAYLNRLPSNKDRRRGAWRPTPLTEGRWLERTNLGDPRVTGYEPSLEDYLDQYGFGIAIDPAIQRQTDQMLREPGAYYAYDRRGGGLVIVDPERRRVVFAYAG